MGKVLFFDCDCIALRGINHLMFGYLTDGENGRTEERPTLNSGNIGIRANHFHEMMTAREKIDMAEPLRRSKNRDQHAWNRLILETTLRHRAFNIGEV